MNTTCMDTVPILQSAILLYGPDHGDLVHATVHPIKEIDGKPTIQAGSPVSRKGLLKAMRGLMNDRVTPELLPEHVLAKGVDHLIWYRKPSRRTIWVRSSELGERSGEIPVPGLIWLANPLTKQCSVFAFAGNERPDAKTELYQAPFFNVWSSGKVCIGTAEAPEGDKALIPENWEEMFFRSWFTHPNTKKLVNGRQRPETFLKSLLDGKKKVFPQKLLLPINRTLGVCFSQLLKGERE